MKLSKDVGQIFFHLSYHSDLPKKEKVSMDVWQERLCSAVAALRNGCRKPINNKSVAVSKCIVDRIL